MATSNILKTLSVAAAGTAFLTLGTLATGTAAQAAELIVNGGFETGDFTGWNVTDQPGSGGTFFVTSPPFAPISGAPTVGPASGSFYAISDQGGPSANALWQTFTVPGTASSVILSYDMFVNDFSGVGPIVDPSGLDYTSGGTGAANQHARVDILVAGANPLSTNPADILGNFYLGVDPQATIPNLYTPYSFDITSLVGAGGSYILRFGQVDNQFFQGQGVDNVSINFQPVSAVPEPASVVGLLTLGVLGLGSTLKRQLK